MKGCLAEQTCVGVKGISLICLNKVSDQGEATKTSCISLTPGTCRDPDITTGSESEIQKIRQRCWVCQTKARATRTHSKKDQEEPPIRLSVWVCLPFTNNQDLKITDSVPVSPAGL